MTGSPGRPRPVRGGAAPPDDGQSGSGGPGPRPAVDHRRRRAPLLRRRARSGSRRAPAARPARRRRHRARHGRPERSGRARARSRVRRGLPGRLRARVERPPPRALSWPGASGSTTWPSCRRSSSTCAPGGTGGRTVYAIGMSNGGFLAEHVARHGLLDLDGVVLVASSATDGIPAGPAGAGTAAAAALPRLPRHGRPPGGLRGRPDRTAGPAVRRAPGREPGVA